MNRNLILVAALIIGSVAAIWLNTGGPAGDPSLSDDPDTVDAYGGTVAVRGGSIDLPPPAADPADLAEAAELGRRLRGPGAAEALAGLGEAQATRAHAQGRIEAWLDRAAADDPDRPGRRIAVHVVLARDRAGVVVEALAVGSGGRIVGRW